MADEAIMDRIAKLLAKAKGTNNEHEAAVFAAKAAEMLAEHNLTEAQIAARDAEDLGPVGEHKYEGRVPDEWRRQILNATAHLYFCKLLWNRGAAKAAYTFRFVGKEHNAKVAAAMGEYFIATVKRMAREYSGARSDQNDFRKGCAARLTERIWALYEEKKGARQSNVANSGNLPALYDSEALAIKQFLEGMRVRSRTSKELRYGAHGWAGREAGDRISLHTQVKETRASRLLK
jgi:hypothetical protein